MRIQTGESLDTHIEGRGPVNAFTVFLTIGAVGFVFLLISLLVGEPFEHRAELIGHGLDPGGPSFLSPRTLAVFVTAFGGTGEIAVQIGFGIVASCIIGILSGGFFATIVFLFVGFLYSQQASSDDDGPGK
jgi:hypothetical protein